MAAVSAVIGTNSFLVVRCVIHVSNGPTLDRGTTYVAFHPFCGFRSRGTGRCDSRLSLATCTALGKPISLSALVALGDGDAKSVDVLRRLIRKGRPTMLPKVS